MQSTCAYGSPFCPCSALIKVIMTEVEEVLMRFVGYTDDSDCEG